MNNIVNPVVVATAFFTAIFFTDLSNNNYKNLPAHALLGFFCILLISVLCKSGMYGFAWLFCALPLLFITGSLIIRDYKIQIADSKTIHYAPPLEHKFHPAPYFL